MISFHMYAKQSFASLQKKLMDEKILAWIFTRLDKRV
jgi:hypothetical protein